jgi:hypothetical protein
MPCRQRWTALRKSVKKFVNADAYGNKLRWIIRCARGLSSLGYESGRYGEFTWCNALDRFALQQSR